MTKVVVRKANLDTDLSQVLPMVKDFLDRTGSNDFLPDTYEELASSLINLAKLEFTNIFVAEYLGRMVGGLGFMYTPNMWNPSSIAAEEIFWWVSKDAPWTTSLKLLRTARLDALEYGCSLVVFKSLISGPKSVDKIYRQMGLRPVEIVYMGVL